MILHRCVLVVVALVAMGNAKMSNGVTSTSTVSIEILCIPIFAAKTYTFDSSPSTLIIQNIFHYYRKESINNRSFPGRSSGASQPRRRRPRHAIRPSRRRRRNTRCGALVGQFRREFHRLPLYNCLRSRQFHRLGFRLLPQFNLQRNQHILRLGFHLFLQLKRQCQRNQPHLRL